MTPDETSKEIERIKGELSAATFAIHFTLNLAGHGATEAIRRRLQLRVVEFYADIADGIAPEGPEWREGVNRFFHRLLQDLPDEDL